MEAICLAVSIPPRSIQVTGKRLGVDKSSLRRTMRRDGPRYKQELLDSSVAAVPCTSAFGGADITEGGRCPISQNVALSLKPRPNTAPAFAHINLSRTTTAAITPTPAPYSVHCSVLCLYEH
ncbi:hypothetical protein J3E68DRAFT_246159 [Trichoderma sp. SZMC 28012]